MRPITAADLMNPKILVVQQDWSLAELATFLVDHEITGAPVADAEGRLVGVVSVVDIAAAASDGNSLASERSSPSFFVRGWEDRISVDEIRDFRVEGEDALVGQIMTPTVFSVPEDATVSTVASTLLRGHLHRLLVTREERPVGIITTSDLLGLLVED